MATGDSYKYAETAVVQNANVPGVFVTTLSMPSGVLPPAAYFFMCTFEYMPAVVGPANGCDIQIVKDSAPLVPLDEVKGLAHASQSFGSIGDMHTAALFGIFEVFEGSQSFNYLMQVASQNGVNIRTRQMRLVQFEVPAPSSDDVLLVIKNSNVKNSALGYAKIEDSGNVTLNAGTYMAMARSNYHVAGPPSGVTGESIRLRRFAPLPELDYFEEISFSDGGGGSDSTSQGGCLWWFCPDIVIGPGNPHDIRYQQASTVNGLEVAASFNRFAFIRLK